MLTMFAWDEGCRNTENCLSKKTKVMSFEVSLKLLLRFLLVYSFLFFFLFLMRSHMLEFFSKMYSSVVVAFSKQQKC